MLSGVFLMTTTGDVLVAKAITASEKRWSAEKFFQKVKSNNSILAPCIEIGRVFYLHCISGDVYIVAVTEDKMISSFTLMESFKSFIRVCGDFIGDVNAKSVLSNTAMVYELIIQMFGSSNPTSVTQQGIAQCKQMGASTLPYEKLFPFVPNNIFGVMPSHDDKYMKSSSASKAPIAYGSKQHKQNEIFVDMIEYLTLILDKKGKVLYKDIEGSMSSKSYLTGPVGVHITLPEKVREKSTGDGDAINIVWKHFTSSEASDGAKLPVVKHFANPGLCGIMDYCVAKDDLSLPFTMYHNFAKAAKGNLIELSLTCKLFCSMPAGHSPINWSAVLPLPSKLVSVSGRSTLQNIKFSKDEKGRSLSIVSPVFPSQAHHSITITMLLSKLLAYTPFEIPFMNLQFEIPNLCISNMKICGLKIHSATSSSTGAINKWVRCVTHSKDYQLQLKHDWV